MGHGDWMFFGGGYMWLVWILLIVITLIFVKSISAESNSKNDKESASDILKKRLATGEINEDEYMRLKKNIEA